MGCTNITNRNTKPLRIVHVISYFQPILGYQEFYLAKEQQEMGHDVYVVTSDRYAPNLYVASRNLLGPRKKGCGYYTEEGIKTWRLPVLFEIQGNVWLLGLRKKLLEISPDVIICHGILNITSLRVLFLKRSIQESKLILDSHMVFCAKRNWTDPFYKLFSFVFRKKMVRAADALIATQSESIKFMKEVYGLPLQRIRLIPLGCDTRLFRRNQEARNEIRSRHKISPKDIVFVYAGKLIPDKGVRILVKSALKLIAENSNLKVMLIGSGDPEYVGKIEKEIAHSGFEDNFISVPLVPHKELCAYYSSADIGVWPKQCSLTMVEAMACGLPVIIADDSGTPERVAHKNGLLYHSGDIEDLIKKMKELLDADTRGKMQRNAIEYAQEMDWTTISRQFLETVS